MKKEITIKKVLLSGVIFSLFFWGIFFSKSAVAHSQLDVVFSKIAWMGTENSANDEWIKIYNNTAEEIDLNGWSIIAGDGSPAIILSGSINAKSFYLLERTDDTSFPEEEASQIYVGVLGNSGEYLALKDASGQIIDELDCGEGWFAGDKDEELAMERIDVLVSGSNADNWRSEGVAEIINSQNTNNNQISNSNNQNTTTVAINNLQEIQDDDVFFQSGIDLKAVAGAFVELFAGQELFFDASFSSGIDTETKYFWNFGDGDTSSEQKIYHSYQYAGEYIAVLQIKKDNFSDTAIRMVNVLDDSVAISELVPNPEGKDDSEWIEIYNKSEQIVDISGWRLDDEEGGSGGYTFLENTLIAAKGYLVFSRDLTKINLNNTSDSVRLFSVSGGLVDEIVYEDVYEGQSLNRISSQKAVWSEMVTPGGKNIIVESSDGKVSAVNAGFAEAYTPTLCEVSGCGSSNGQNPPNIIKKTETFWDNFSIARVAQAEQSESDFVPSVDIYEQYSAGALAALTREIPNNQTSPVIARSGSQDATKQSQADTVVISTSSSVIPAKAGISTESQNDNQKNKSTLTITFCVGALGAFGIAFIDRRLRA